MGRVLWVKKQILLLSFIFLIALPGVLAQACCLYPYDGADLIFDTGNENQEYCNAEAPGSLFVADCTETILTESACCFDTAGNIEGFGVEQSSLADETQINSEYCVQSGFTPLNPTNGQCVYDVEPTVFHDVSGMVYLGTLNGQDVSDELIALPGVVVRAENEILIEAVTDASGAYALGLTPGVQSGANEFTASVSASYSFPYTGTNVILNGAASNGEVPLLCSIADLSQTFPSTFSTQEIDFFMECDVITDVCIPDWQTGPWSACQPYAGQNVKTRTVWDANECGTLQGRPITLLTQNTPPPENQFYDCQPTSSGSICGNGIVEGNEQCENGQLINPATGQIESVSSLACTVFSTSYEPGGSVTCGSDCGYDYTQCTNPCAVCNGGLECDTCASCQGSPACTPICENTAPQFYPHFDNAEREETRNVVNSYLDPLEDEGFDYFTGVVYSSGSKDVTIKWQSEQSLACVSEINSFRIYVCEENEENTNACAPNTETTYFANGDAQEITLQNILEEEQTNYCYNVCSVTESGIEFCAVQGDNALPCFSSGDAYCHEPGSEGLSCIFDEETQQDQPYGCNVIEVDGIIYTNHSLGPGPETCLPEAQCINTVFVEGNANLPGAVCVEEFDNCALCNGLFGQYASYEASVDINDISVSCLALQYDPEIPTLVPSIENAVGMCYLDQSTASYIDQYDACDTITTCYDYASRDACSADPCFKFTSLDDNDQAQNACEWNSYSNELGIGVCAPKETPAQDCLRCDTDSPTGICDESMCASYGSCYFKEQQHHDFGVFKERSLLQSPELNRFIREDNTPLLPSCLAQEAITCFFYDNEQDCTGGTSSSHDISYNEFSDLEGNVFYSRSGGTHERTLSNDALGFGTCKWINQPQNNVVGCYKDSDDLTLLSNTPGVQNYADDCFDADQSFTAENRVRCLYDHEVPETIITLREPPVNPEDYQLDGDGNPLPVYGFGQLEEIVFTATDNEWGDDGITTYVQIRPYTDNCNENGCPSGYPILSLDYHQSSGFEEFEDLESGQHTIIYYSQDRAKNLEVLKYATFYLDTEGPELIELNYTLDTFNLTEDVFRTNVSVEFSISEASYCEGGLFDILGGLNDNNPDDDSPLQVGNLFGNFGSLFSLNYTFVQDGLYFFNYTCLDDFGNDLVGAELIVIDANPSITNPQPQAEIFSSFADIQLSIETYRSAECRFSTDNSPYSSSPGYYTTTSQGDTIHISNLPTAEMLEDDPSLQPFIDMGLDGASGTYFIYNACYFDFPDPIEDEITEQDLGDVISFTVDKEAPLIEVKYLSQLSGAFEPFSLSETAWTDQRDFQLTCSDENDLLPIARFGCDTIEYCFAASSATLDDFSEEQCVTELISTTETVASFSVSHEQQGNLPLFYRGTDAGGNTAGWQRINPKLRNLEFTDPEIFFVE